MQQLTCFQRYSTIRGLLSNWGPFFTVFGARSRLWQTSARFHCWFRPADLGELGLQLVRKSGSFSGWKPDTSSETCCRWTGPCKRNSFTLLIALRRVLPVVGCFIDVFLTCFRCAQWKMSGQRYFTFTPIDKNRC